MNIELLHQTAQEVVGKAVLAADESTDTIKDRLSRIGVESTPDINRGYRLLLFETPGIGEYVSGVILYDETIRQSDDKLLPIPELLAQKGIVPGIKVDRGTVKLPVFGKDKYTQGLDDLAKRLAEYKSLGARFAKWRAVFTIDYEHPLDLTVDRNAHDLALYASICQDSGITPMVEPEVLMEGSHSLKDSERVTAKVLTSVFRRLSEYGVHPQGMILKPNMITPGKDHSERATAEAVARVTLGVLRDTVPTDIPGITFLSGGQSPELATIHLNAINQLRNVNPTRYPWRITASFGRALQGEAIEAWAGKVENIPTAQTVFINRAEKVYKASLGQL